MIELKNINGGYGKKQVLFDINTIMHENEITSISVRTDAENQRFLKYPPD